jgi:predicted nucleic acid-binding protein
VPVLLDTSVYLFALRSAAGAALFERLFRPIIFRTHLSSVVVVELYAGAVDSLAVRLVERHVGALERTGRIIAPTFEDWKEAGKLIARITRKDRGQKPRVQQMLNDILLALCARRLGAELFTFNRDDFELIRRHRPFSLRVLRADDR